MTCPLPARGDTLGADPLYNAWEEVRLARRVPWDAMRPEAWRKRFQGHLANARAQFLGHIAAAEAPGAVPVAICGSVGDAPNWLLAQLSEHAALSDAFEELHDRVCSAAATFVDAIVDVSERAILLEMQIARHQNRLRAALEARGASQMAISAIGGKTR